MEWIPWNDILKIGHAAIDAEHMAMVRLFNQLTEAVKNNQGKRICANALDNIIEYTISHFKHEAELMAEHQFPKADQHNLEHAQLIKRARNYRVKFESGASGSHIELIHFPEDWLTRHILTWDKELGEFLTAQNGGTVAGHKPL